jgi:hypothetical protein
MVQQMVCHSCLAWYLHIANGVPDTFLFLWYSICLGKSYERFRNIFVDIQEMLGIMSI